MRTLLLALAFALPSPSFAAAPTTREFVELPPGSYTVALTGLLTTVCGRSIAAEWARLPEIESAAVNFDKSEATISVRLGRTMRVSSLRKTLRRAERLANLGGHYDLSSIAYKLGK